MKFVFALITPYCKVLGSWNLHHSAPLDVPFPMATFWLKTMDCTILVKFLSALITLLEGARKLKFVAFSCS